MDTAQAKWFLRIFAHGKKLDKLTIRELYLSGYIAIELHSPGNDPLPTAITEKGKRALGSHPWTKFPSGYDGPMVA